MITEEQADESINFLMKASSEYGRAMSEVAYIENALKRVKAQGMSDSDKKTLGDREMDAYLTDEYMTMLQGYRAAVHAKEELKWQMESHKMRFEKWKVEQFNQRVEARAF